MEDKARMFQNTTATRRIFSLKKRIRAVAGGTSASKTISILVWLIDYAQTTKNEVITVVAESVPHLELGAIRDFKSIMQVHGYWDENSWVSKPAKYTFKDGSFIEFISFDKFGKAHGPRRDVLFLNEANNIPYLIADQLITRTRRIVWMDWNPSEEFYFYTEMLGRREDIDFITLTYLDNEALDDVSRMEIESHRHNKQWWTVYGEGKLGVIESRIYKNWQIIDEIPHEARLERYGLDFGYTNDPTALEGIYRYNGGFILDEVLFQKGLSNKQISDVLTNQPPALVVADSAEPKSIDEIRGYGINIIGTVKGKDSVNHGIQIVQDQRISITSRSLNTIKAYRNYLWITDKTGAIINEPNHLYSDCFVAGTKITLKNGKTKNIENIKVGDIVKTQNGYNDVAISRPDYGNDKLYEIVLSNGSKLKGTGRHKIYTKRGKVPIDSLRYGDIIEVLDNKKLLLCKKKLCSMGKSINYQVDILKEIIGAKEIVFTKQRGSTITEKYQKDVIYITKTEIKKTIKSIILNVLIAENTYQNIIKKIGITKSLGKKLEKIATVLDTLQRNGTLLQKELNGISRMVSKYSRIGKRLRGFVNSVEKNIKHILTDETDFAITIVRRRRCVKEGVYSLGINNEHNYYANGILVANCMDAIRYGLTSLLKEPEDTEEERERVLTNRIDRRLNDFGI